METMRAFFFPKTGLPLHSGWVPVRVVKYASTSLTIHKYPWKYLNKLFYARALNMLDYLTMFDRLLKMPWVLNAPGFWIWHGYYKGYTEFWTWVNMAQYASIIPEYTLMSHNVSENCWILLNVPEYTWKRQDKLFWWWWWLWWWLWLLLLLLLLLL